MAKFKTPSEMNELLHSKMPQLIEPFVKVHGEKYRERITERLNNTIFIVLHSDRSFKDAFEYEEEMQRFIQKHIDIVDIEQEYSDVKHMTMFDQMAAGVIVSASYNDLTQPKCLCFLPNLEELSDKVLIHELNHVVQSDVIIDKDNFIARNGLKRINYKLSLEDRKVEFLDVTNAHVEAFQEVYTDYTSLKVYEIVKNDGFSLGLSAGEKSAYSVAFPMLGEFIDKHKDTLAKCFLEGKRKGLIKEIGKDNFEKLIEATGSAIDFESEHGLYIKSAMEENHTNLETLLKEDFNKIPLSLRFYVDMMKNVSRVVDKIELENDSEQEIY